MDILDVLRADGSIVVNKKLAHTIGLNEAIMYSELVSLLKYWSNRDELVDGKWFFCTAKNLEENTAMKRKPQDRSISNLQKQGLIEVKKMGLPAKKYFSITNKIYDLFNDGTNKDDQNGQTGHDNGLSNQKGDNPRHNQLDQNGQTGMSEKGKQDCPKGATNNTKINNTDLITQEEEINNARLKHISLEQTYNFLLIKGLDEETAKNTIARLIDKNVLSFPKENIESQFEIMMNKLEERDSHPNFPEYFAEGLRMMLYQTKANHFFQQKKQEEQEQAMEQNSKRDISFYYDWLNEEEGEI